MLTAPDVMETRFLPRRAAVIGAQHPERRILDVVLPSKPTVRIVKKPEFGHVAHAMPHRIKHLCPCSASIRRFEEQRVRPRDMGEAAVRDDVVVPVDEGLLVVQTTHPWLNNMDGECAALSIEQALARMGYHVLRRVGQASYVSAC